MADARQDLFRAIPSIEALLEEDEFRQAALEGPRRIVVAGLREAVEALRSTLRGEPLDGLSATVLVERIRADARRRIAAALQPHYRRVINATGVILHTALGRAVLAQQAVRQIVDELSGYSLLQADLETGRRSRRDARIEWLLNQLTGAEAATVVNNNAAATAIVLNTFAKGREVIISRGQLVEIGGSFRLPDVIAASGARLVEVGTTNRTHPADYAAAITESTAAILRVHPSNYQISGFTAETSLEDLVRIAHARDVLMIDDLGAGALFDVSRFGFDKEPLLADSLRAGADLVTASADKLIGAAQGGLILGRSELIQSIRKNPFARIVRVGKLTLAALEATLLLHLDPSRSLAEIPTWRMLNRSLAEVAAQAQRIAAAVGSRAPQAGVELIDGLTQMGSGSLPTQGVATRLVAVVHRSRGFDELALRLRRHQPPVFARIHKGQLLLDPRTLLPGEEESLVEALVEALS
jgi:L-seryl-tRNA(Ser) seleniumtransferase